MAAKKPTVLFSPLFSTILDAFGSDQLIVRVAAILDRAQRDAWFKRIHGMSRKDWDAALSLHLHGDLQ